MELGRPCPEEGDCSRGFDLAGELNDVGVDAEPSPYNIDDQIDFCAHHRYNDAAIQYLSFTVTF